VFGRPSSVTKEVFVRFKGLALIPLTALGVSFFSCYAEAEPLFVSPVAAWETRDGAYTVEHLAGASSQGDLRVFFRLARTYPWQMGTYLKLLAGKKLSGR
jgi:hypothetical protein